MFIFEESFDILSAKEVFERIELLKPSKEIFKLNFHCGNI